MLSITLTAPIEILWLQKNKGKTIEDAPTQIAYKKYREFRAEHGLELVGYPEEHRTESGDLVNPNQFRHISQFKDLHYAVTHGSVFWRELSEIEWKTAQDEMHVSRLTVQTDKMRKKANEAARVVAKKRVGTSKARSSKKRNPTSQPIVPDSDNDENHDEAQNAEASSSSLL